MEQNQLDAFRQALIAHREEIEQLNNTGKEYLGQGVLVYDIELVSVTPTTTPNPAEK